MREDSKAVQVRMDPQLYKQVKRRADALAMKMGPLGRKLFESLCELPPGTAWKVVGPEGEEVTREEFAEMAEQLKRELADEFTARLEKMAEHQRLQSEQHAAERAADREERSELRKLLEKVIAGKGGK